MDDAGPGQFRQRRVVVEQSVLQGALAVARARVNHQPGRLVHYQQMGVLVENTQGDGLGGDPLFLLQLGAQRDLLAAGHLVPGPRLATVDGDLALPDPLLDAAARVVRQQRCQCLVQPLARLCVFDQDVVFYSSAHDAFPLRQGA